MNSSTSLWVIMSERSTPNYFIHEVLKSKNSVQNDFQIMARGRVAMEIQAAGGFEDAMQFHQSRRHHRQIRHHRGIFQEGMQRLHHFHDGGVLAGVNKLGVGL